MSSQPADKTVPKEEQRVTGPVAVIDIGATSLRMAIAQCGAEGEVETLETLTQAVSLGKDSFIKGHIAHQTIEDCVRVLRIYRQKLNEYQIIDPKRIRIVATSAVREASNRLAFLDRIFVATGLEVEPFDEAELHRTTYLSIEPVLRHAAELTNESQVICEVGGGSTEVLVLAAGDILYSQTFRLGSLRLQKTLEALDTPQVKVRDIMEQQIDQTVAQLCNALPASASRNMVSMGGDMRFAVSQLHPDWDRQRLARLNLKSFEMLAERILALTPDQIYHKYHLSYPDAETLGPALLANLHFALALEVDAIFVANASLRDGLLNEIFRQDTWSATFQNQVVRFALDLGLKYKFDQSHALHVAHLCENLFDHLQPEHQLDSRHRVILYVAALLHEIGMFVSNRSYHKHSMYLIQNSQFFGFGKRDLMLTSLVARYHRRAHPQPTHLGFEGLVREDRVTVCKLAAILRIGIALDESRSQRFQEFQTRIQKDRVLISVPNVADLSLEQVALRQYGLLFEEIYGKRVVLTHAAV